MEKGDVYSTKSSGLSRCGPGVSLSPYPLSQLRERGRTRRQAADHLPLPRALGEGAGGRGSLGLTQEKLRWATN